MASKADGPHTGVRLLLVAQLRAVSFGKGSARRLAMHNNAIMAYLSMVVLGIIPAVQASSTMQGARAIALSFPSSHVV